MSLEARGLWYTYPGWEPTLRGVDLLLEGGSGFLLGPSGSGKSTLLRCIAGLEACRGEVLVDRQPVHHLPPHRRKVGLMFQDAALFPHLDVWRNVAFGLPYRGVLRRQRRAEAEQWLDVAGLPGRPEAKVHELSGGERQRVALARTLAARPKVVLLDEPFAGLDQPLRERLGPRVKAVLAEHGATALWVTHDRAEAFRLGDKVWELVAGRVVAAERPG